MNEIIYKYDLLVQDGRQIIQLPRGAKPLSVGFQRAVSGNLLDAPVLRVWAVVDPDLIARHPATHMAPFTFLVLATGVAARIEGLNFLGRADIEGLVFHVFCARGGGGGGGPGGGAKARRGFPRRGSA